MIRQTAKILRYELHNLIRSRWVLLIGVFFFLSSETMFRFGSDPAKALISLMNIILIVLPLMSLILGVIYFYHSREFVELLLAQPIMRSSIYLGKITGLAVALSIVFVVGLGLPFLLHGSALADYWASFVVVVAVGCAFIMIFTAIAFMVATIYEDKIKGFGTAILLWLYLAVIYDALILVAIYVFREYPFERALIALAMLNPVDLGRILILLRLDIAALMGYTGAVFKQFYGSAAGVGLSGGVLLLWLAVPMTIGLIKFHRKDF
jgi:Cu-processing system permease protein